MLAAIGAAYARDVQSFTRLLADLASAFGIDIRTVWQVDPLIPRTLHEGRAQRHRLRMRLGGAYGREAFAKLAWCFRRQDLVSGMLMNAVMRLGRPGAERDGRYWPFIRRPSFFRPLRPRRCLGLAA